jgi:protein-S-isoprenylcysteine O-methyltransferase Ste14
MWGILYVVLLGALVVRFRTSGEFSPPEPARPLPGERLWLTHAHHALFLLVLLGTPIERVLFGGAATGRWLGAGLFTAGVALYRVAGRTLGDALSPFTEPREAVPLVTAGLYRYLRHPMYLSEALIAIGAPLTLGSRGVLWLSFAAVAVLLVRILCEEEALARTFPEYSRYAARTKRVFPFLY